MRTLSIIGAVLILVGGFLFVRGGTFTSRRDVLDVGGLRITADEQHPVAPWLAGVAIVAGLGLIVADARGKA